MKSRSKLRARATMIRATCARAAHSMLMDRKSARVALSRLHHCFPGLDAAVVSGFNQSRPRPQLLQPVFCIFH